MLPSIPLMQRRPRPEIETNRGVSEILNYLLPFSAYDNLVDLANCIRRVARWKFLQSNLSIESRAWTGPVKSFATLFFSRRIRPELA